MSAFCWKDLMRVTTSLFFVALCITAVSVASGQVRETSKEQNAAINPSESAGDPPATASSKNQEDPLISIHLIGGGKLDVQELRETPDGIWYTRGGVTTLLDLKRVAKIERPSNKETQPPAEAVKWSISDSGKVETFFITKFGRPLPISTFGQSALHRRWGLDHRQGIDVGLHPDSREGAVLVEFLRSERIPFLVFRGPIPGVSTGPHIHIGRASHRFLPR